jgi:uncharacterized protein YukE
MAKIYISSTYGDLKEYREKVYQVLRQLGHDTVAMEDYVATGQHPPLDKCLSDVAGSDCYVGIFAWRYGYIPEGENNPKGKSITELEYCRATEAGKPCFIFLLDENAPWLPKFTDSHTGEGDEGKKIEELRQELGKNKLISFFTSAEELSGLVSVAISNWQKEQPTVSQAISALVDLMQFPEVRENISKFRITFEDSKQHIDILGDYKELHDQLHTLEFQCQRMISQILDEFTENETLSNAAKNRISRNLKQYQRTLETILKEVEEVATRFQKNQQISNPVKMLADSIVQFLTDAQKLLSEGIEKLDLGLLAESVDWMKGLLATYPVRINSGLIQTASSLKFNDLVQAMSQVISYLNKAKVDAGKVNLVQQGTESLKAMSELLPNLIENHDQLQTLDGEIRLIEKNLKQALERSWRSRNLKTKTETICQKISDMTERYVDCEIRELSKKRTKEAALDCERATQTLDNALNAGDVDKIVDAFLDYRSLADDLFYVIDTDIKNFCSALKEIGQPLKNVLEAMSS